MTRLLPGVLRGLLLLALLACTPESHDVSPTPPVPAGPGGPILAEIARALGAEAEDPEFESIHSPECPAGYERTVASASFDGVRIWVSRTFGPCPGSDGGYFACDGVPQRPGHAVELRDCLTRELGDGTVLVAGRLVVYQESESLLAVVGEPDRQCVLGADVEGGPDLETLVRLAAEIRCE